MPATLLSKGVAAAALSLLLLSGCGYHPVVARGPLAEANGVNVTLFANMTYRPGVEGVLAREMVDELALRSGGKVLPANQAQLEMIGVVRSYVSLPVSYTAQDTIKEYRAIMKVQATLRETQSQKVLWKEELTEDQTFPVNPNIALQQNAEDAAIQKISRKLAQAVWQKIGERF